MTEQNNPYGPYNNSNSPTGAEGEAAQSPNYQTEAPAEQNPYEQVPSAPQQNTTGQPGPQVTDYTAAQQPAQPNPYTQQASGYSQQPAAGQADPSAQQAPGYGQPNSAQQGAPGYGQQATTGQPGAYGVPGYGQPGPAQPGFGQPVFDAYGNQIPSDAKSMALFAHLSGLISLVVTAAYLNFIGPLIMWFIYKDKPGYQFVRHAAAGAFNFSFTMWLINVALWVLTFVTFGIAVFFTLPAIIAVCVVIVILHIIAAIKANNGEVYNYPMTIKILN